MKHRKGRTISTNDSWQARQEAWDFHKQNGTTGIGKRPTKENPYPNPVIREVYKPQEDNRAKNSGLKDFDWHRA
jgi:hypothetical protein